MKVRLLVVFFCIFSSLPGFSAQNCIAGKIEEITSGPLYGTLIRMEDSNCGKQGWVCLDPDGERMSVNVAKQVYSLALAKHIAGTRVSITVHDDGVFANACGGSLYSFPVVYDLRSSN